MNWQHVELGKVAPAKPSRKKKLLPDDKIWLLNLDKIESQSGRVVDKLIVPFSEIGASTNWFSENHVLYSKLRPYLNKVVLPSANGVATSELLPLLPDPSILDKKYLAFYLRSEQFVSWANEQTAGAKMPRVSTKLFWKHKIPLPPLPVQKQIAAVLEKADTLRQQSQQMEQEFNSLAQSVFLEMFGDYRKSSQALTKCLGDVSDVRSGVTKGQKLDGHEQITVPYMRVANVQDGYLDLSEIKDITVKVKDYEKYLLHAGDILMTEGGDYDKLGRGAIWEGQIEDCIHQNHVFRVRLGAEYTSEFFAYYLQTPFVKEYFLKCAKKTTNLASINITQLKNLPMPNESLEKQQGFLKFIEKLTVLKKLSYNQQEKAEAHFNSLMQRAFKGELDLKDVA